MTQKEQWRETLLIVVQIVGGLVLTAFPLVYWSQGLYIYAAIEFIGGLCLWTSLFIVKKFHTYYWPARITWFGSMLALTTLLFTGGIGGTGLYWWSLLPIIAFIIFGTKGGQKALFVSATIFVSIVLLNQLHVFSIYYSMTEIIIALISNAIISIIMCCYEKISDQARDEAEKKADLLSEQVDLKMDVDQELYDNIKLLENEKNRQSNVRAAMMNLLEDSKELEIQLQEEKANVEKKVEERTLELSNTKAKLDSSIENLPLGFLMVDIEEKLVVTNSLANNILKGKNESENLANIKNILKEKIDLEKYIKNCGKDKKREAITDVELNGRYFQFLLSPILTQDPNTVCIGIVILIQDITEAKILDRSKDEFFSIASHELRTPLTAIRGNTSMILEYYADAIKEPELKDMINDVHESSIRLINIVNDFLNVSRLEQSRMVYNLKETNLEELIPETIKEYDVTGSRHNLSIDFVPSEKVPLVMSDPDKVRQVLINLLGNAIKFTSKGGITITTETNDKYVKVFVTDTGRGIALKQQSLLFHKFQQTGASLFTRDTSGGSGLGLYISKMMIKGMGGDVKLEKSEENKGSTFSFSLPIASKMDQEKKTSQPDTQTNTTQESVK